MSTFITEIYTLFDNKPLNFDNTYTYYKPEPYFSDPR